MPQIGWFLTISSFKIIYLKIYKISPYFKNFTSISFNGPHSIKTEYKKQKLKAHIKLHTSSKFMSNKWEKLMVCDFFAIYDLSALKLHYS